LDSEEVADGLADDGFLLVNTNRSPAEIWSSLSLKPTQRVYTTNASEIALETIGRDIPNMVMIGALIRLTDIMSMDRLEENMRKKFRRKFSDSVIDGNLRAIHRAYQEVH
ncbi:MAG: 2-oxoacid:acceptor oxidoreductase family protein, partial [Acidobacteria bacterium]|nr:2-oxoacid:acceptor oxidoreductase family protein [Acidobacteriota bacterium]